MAVMTPAELQATLPPGCVVAQLQGRAVIVWTGQGPMPREVLARFGNKREREENYRWRHVLDERRSHR